MNTIFFQHIMKTAGTSFRNMLYDSLGDLVYPTREELKKNKGWYLNIHQIIEASKLEDLNLNSRSVFCGHYPYVLGKKILEDPFYATFLRNPVDRTLSIIEHRKRRFSEFKNTTVSDFLDDKTFVENQIENYQTKIFALDSFEASNINTNYPIVDTNFKLALNRLQQADFVGITEQFNLSVKLFSSKTGINFRETIRSNCGGGIHANEDDIERIKKLVFYDSILYQEAIIKFKRDSLQLVELS